MIESFDKRHIQYHFSLDHWKEEGYKIPVFRIIPFEYLIDMILNKYLWISPVSSWEDVYENFLAKVKFKFQGSPISLKEYIPCFFGQCWSLQNSSDAMWRIYSSDLKGVRITTRIDKLIESSKEELDYEDFSTEIRLIGKVNYLNEQSIRTSIEKLSFSDLGPQIMRESFFIKRLAFEHESEIRLVIQKTVKENEEYLRSHLKLNIEPNDFIDEIQFDPRITQNVFKNYETIIRNLGFKNKISKSSLYSFDDSFSLDL